MKAPHPAARAFSMLEMVVSIMVLAIIAGVLLPVVGGATDAYASSAAIRDGSERAAFALERCGRLLRDWPAGDSNTSVAAVKFDGASTLVYPDGRGLTLSGTDLCLIDADGSQSVLCRNVKSFTLTLLQYDGLTSAASDTTRTQRVNVSLVTTDLQLTCTSFLRARAVSS